MYLLVEPPGHYPQAVPTWTLPPSCTFVPFSRTTWTLPPDTTPNLYLFLLYRRGHYLQAVHLYLLLEPRGHCHLDTTPKLYRRGHYPRTLPPSCTDVDTTPGHYPRTLPQPVFVFILATCICLPVPRIRSSSGHFLPVSISDLHIAVHRLGDVQFVSSSSDFFAGFGEKGGGRNKIDFCMSNIIEINLLFYAPPNF